MSRCNQTASSSMGRGALQQVTRAHRIMSGVTERWHPDGPGSGSSLDYTAWLLCGPGCVFQSSGGHAVSYYDTKLMLLKMNVISLSVCCGCGFRNCAVVFYRLPCTASFSINPPLLNSNTKLLCLYFSPHGVYTAICLNSLYTGY